MAMLYELLRVPIVAINSDLTRIHFCFFGSFLLDLAMLYELFRVPI